MREAGFTITLDSWLYEPGTPNTDRLLFTYDIDYDKSNLILTYNGEKLVMDLDELDAVVKAFKVIRKAYL